MATEFLEGVGGENVIVKDLAPIIRDDDQLNGDPAQLTGEPGTMPAEVVFATADEIQTVLQMLFTGGGLLFRHDHWTDDATDEEIKDMLPAAEKWVNRWPALAGAVKRADTEAFPVMLLYSWGKRFIKSIRLKKAERQEKKQTVEEALPYATPGYTAGLSGTGR